MIAIRADANPVIGSGHIMRCISVAKEIERGGTECVFLTADHEADNLLDKMKMKH